MTAATAAYRPGAAVTVLAVRQVYWGAAVVAVVSAGMSMLVAGTYAGVVAGGVDGSSIAALAANPAIRTLFGEPAGLDTAGGFTVWRTGTPLAVLAGVWGSLMATRVTRGEEDAGRWDLLAAGRLPIAGLVWRHLAVLVVAVAAVGIAVSVGLLAAGTAAAGALVHGCGIALVGMFFAGAGGLAGQMFATRAVASGAVVALLGAGLLIRMVGNGVAALSWLRWLSPFGLVELSRPYAGDRWAALLPLATAAAGVLAAGWAVAGRRDLRRGVLNPATRRAPRTRLLGSVPAFAVRRLLRSWSGWALGIGAYFLLIGMVAESMTRFLTDNPQFARLAAQAGFGGLDSIDGYAATLFALLAIPVGLFTVVRVATFAADETERRLALLHARPISRAGLAGAEAAVTAGGAVLLAVVAGLAAWTGTAVVGAELGLAGALAGAVNVLPVAALCLGASMLALGVAPRMVAMVGSLPAAGGFLLRVIAESFDAPAWVGDLSPFSHLGAVPADAPDWPGVAGMVSIAALWTIAGLWTYQRRDSRLS